MTNEQPTSENILEILKSVRYPGYKRDIVSFGMVKDVSIKGCAVNISLNIKTENAEVPDKIADEAKKAIKAKYPKYAVVVENTMPVSSEKSASAGRSASPFDQKEIPGVRYAIAVGSGKGGVGKSTVAVNLALALKSLGYEVGIMDADVYGPSLPLMMGTNDKPRVDDENHILPITAHGVKVMSIGFLITEDAPVIWRGLMVTKLIEQFLTDINWGKLDFLVIDLPPGTGDTQLTLVQKTRLAGAVIVTTPQDIALIDAVKAANMFGQVQVPVLGIVENMSYFKCPKCGEETKIFGSGGGERESNRLGVPLLGAIPLNPQIREGSDTGRPVVATDADGADTKIFLSIAEKIVKQINP